MIGKFQIVFIAVFLIFISLSCSNKCNVEGIEVSELLATSSGEKGIQYCSLLEDALRGNEKAIAELSLLEFSNATGYDHGAVIVDLVLKIGEKKYIKAISAINKEQRSLIQSYIDVGLEYGRNPVIKSRDIKEAFPNLYLVLK